MALNGFEVKYRSTKLNGSGGSMSEELKKAADSQSG